MAIRKSLTIGIVQSGPECMNVEKSMAKAVYLIAEAAGKGAELVVFGETWLTGYPAWLDHCPEVALWNYEPTKELFAQMYNNSIHIPGEETEVLAGLARKFEIVICMGVNEVVASGAGSGTIYNSLIIFDAQGTLVNHHRKLMPTYTEKLLYGMGDGHGLKAVETHLGRVGGLICWEHWMPLARQTMHLSNEHIHVALWPTVHEMHQIASRQYAFEGRCFVVAAGQIMRVKDFPAQLKLPEKLENKPDEFILNGGSCIIAPDGKYVLEPQWNTEGVIIHEIPNLDSIYKERMTLDTSGHYNRSDIFDFKVNKDRYVN